VWICEACAGLGLGEIGPGSQVARVVRSMKRGYVKRQAHAGKTKVSMNLFDEDLEAMEKIAEWRRSTKTEAVRGALATEKVLREAVLGGAKVLIEEPGQPVKQIVFR
jgi:hypothetical protein